jgi:hypothetical protein
MSSNTTSRKDEPAILPSHQLPVEYLCINDAQAVQVFDYLNGADDKVDKELVFVHLKLCYQCQEAVAALITLDATVRERVTRLKQEREPVPV